MTQINLDTIHFFDDYTEQAIVYNSPLASYTAISQNVHNKICSLCYLGNRWWSVLVIHTSDILFLIKYRSHGHESCEYKAHVYTYKKLASCNSLQKWQVNIQMYLELFSHLVDRGQLFAQNERTISKQGKPFDWSEKHSTLFLSAWTSLRNV